MTDMDRLRAQRRQAWASVELCQKLAQDMATRHVDDPQLISKATLLFAEARNVLTQLAELELSRRQMLAGKRASAFERDGAKLFHPRTRA
jgi:hypothetical protein